MTTPGIIPPAPPPPPLSMPQQQYGTSSTLGQTGLINQPGLFEGQQPKHRQSMGGETLGGPLMQQVRAEPIRTETFQREPVIMEKIEQIEKDIIKPIIHREREQTEIHQITQPYMEKQIRPEVFQTRELPAEYRTPVVYNAPEETVRQYQEERKKLRSSVNYLPKQTQMMEERPVVMEDIKKIVCEEIQPIIYREIVQPTVLKETKHIYEKVVEAPRLLQETRELRPLTDMRGWGQQQQPMPMPLQQLSAPLQAQPQQQFQQQPMMMPQQQQPMMMPQQQQPMMMPQQQQPMMMPQQQQPSMLREQPSMGFPQMMAPAPGLWLNRDITDVERHKSFPAFLTATPMQDVRAHSWSSSSPFSSMSGWGGGMPFGGQQPSSWGGMQQPGYGGWQQQSGWGGMQPWQQSGGYGSSYGQQPGFGGGGQPGYSGIPHFARHTPY